MLFCENINIFYVLKLEGLLNQSYGFFYGIFAAVVKSGKLYAVQRHVNQLLRVVRLMLEGRRFESISNC